MAAAAPTKAQKPTYLWERNYDPKVIEGKIERTVKDIQDTRIANVTFYIFIVLKGLAFLTGAFGIMGLGALLAIKLPLSLAGLASVVTLVAFTAFIRFSLTWFLSGEIPKCLTNLEGKLDKLFNKMFVADKGKLTPEHLKLLQKHAVEIRNPTINHYLNNFTLGLDSKKSIKSLAALFPETHDVVQEVLSRLITTSIVSNKLVDSLHEEITKANSDIVNKTYDKEFCLNWLKGRLEIPFKASSDTNTFIVDEQDANQLLKSMTKRQKLDVYTATDETFKAMQDLPVTEMCLYGVDYTAERAALMPKTLKKLHWQSFKRDIDLKPLAARCPDIEDLECRGHKPDDLKLFKKLKTS